MKYRMHIILKIKEKEKMLQSNRNENESNRLECTSCVNVNLVGFGKLGAYRSHWRNVQDAIIHSETMNTSSTVPGQMVISVFNTNLKKEKQREIERGRERKIRRV